MHLQTLRHGPDIHGQREDPHRARVHPRQGQGHRLLPRILPVPRLPQGSAFFHREISHAAARHRQVHRIAVERRACHGVEVPAVMPLYRQEREGKEIGLPLSRATLANWVIRPDER